MTRRFFNNFALILMLGSVVALFCVSAETYRGAGFFVDLDRSFMQQLFAALIEDSDIIDKDSAAYQSTLFAFLFSCWGAIAQHREVGRWLKRSVRKLAKYYRPRRQAHHPLKNHHLLAG